MASATQRLYESPLEKSFVDLLYDDLTKLASGIRIVSGDGVPMRVSMTNLGIPTSRTYAPGSDATWAFSVPPAVTLVLGGVTLAALSNYGASHSPALSADIAVAPIL